MELKAFSLVLAHPQNALAKTMHHTYNQWRCISHLVDNEVARSWRGTFKLRQQLTNASVRPNCKDLEFPNQFVAAINNKLGPCFNLITFSKIKHNEIPARIHSGDFTTQIGRNHCIG